MWPRVVPADGGPWDGFDPKASTRVTRAPGRGAEPSPSERADSRLWERNCLFKSVDLFKLTICVNRDLYVGLDRRTQHEEGLVRWDWDRWRSQCALEGRWGHGGEGFGLPPAAHDAQPARTLAVPSLALPARPSLARARPERAVVVRERAHPHAERAALLQPEALRASLRGARGTCLCGRVLSGDGAVRRDGSRCPSPGAGGWAPLRDGGGPQGRVALPVRGRRVRAVLGGLRVRVGRVRRDRVDQHRPQRMRQVVAHALDHHQA